MFLKHFSPRGKNHKLFTVLVSHIGKYFSFVTFGHIFLC